MRRNGTFLVLGILNLPVLGKLLVFLVLPMSFEALLALIGDALPGFFASLFDVGSSAILYDRIIELLLTFFLGLDPQNGSIRGVIRDSELARGCSVSRTTWQVVAAGLDI